MDVWFFVWGAAIWTMCGREGRRGGKDDGRGDEPGSLKKY